jgi:hypothetical protein
MDKISSGEQGKQSHAEKETQLGSKDPTIELIYHPLVGVTAWLRGDGWEDTAVAPKACDAIAKVMQKRGLFPS